MSSKRVTPLCAGCKLITSTCIFCHRADPSTPIEETVRTMSDLIAQGKVLYWGTSEWSAAAILRANAIARELHLVPPTMEQPQYNMFEREKVEREFLPLRSEERRVGKE